MIYPNTLLFLFFKFNLNWKDSVIHKLITLNYKIFQYKSNKYCNFKTWMLVYVVELIFFFFCQLLLNQDDFDINLNC